jgi:hypothetical protein
MSLFMMLQTTLKAGVFKGLSRSMGGQTHPVKTAESLLGFAACNPTPKELEWGRASGKEGAIWLKIY